MAAAEYPRRPKFFAHKFVRLMAKVCLANEIGPEACWMLAVIAHTEDAGHYRKPVTFFNEQLRPLAGVGSISALRRLRDKVVGSGWLHYESGAKGRAPRYWVIVPPYADGLDDGPTDEQPDEYSCSEMNMNGDGHTCSPVDRKAARKRQESEQESGKKAAGIPNPPKEDSLTLPLSLSTAREFEKFWEQYPKKSKRDEAILEWSKLSPSTELQIAILEAIGRHLRTNPQWLRESGRYIPNAANWLRDRQWEWNQPRQIVREDVQPTPEQLEKQRRRALGDVIYERTYGKK